MNISPSLFKQLTSMLLFSTLGWFAAPAGATLTVADTPLFLTATVEPNIVLTLDDSGSMARAFTPDLCGNPNGICNSNPDSSLDPRYVKSAKYNPLYYNPSTTYAPALNADGTARSTSFTAAYINGFDTSYGTTNLSSAYRPSAGLWLHSTADRSHQFMSHYASDVQCKASTNRCQHKDASGNWANMTEVTACSTDSQCQIRTMPAYYYVFDSSNSPCDGTATDNRCYDIKIVSSTSGPGATDERQNFANWYSFYRTRNLATVTAASRAFGSPDFDPSIRVAWQALNSCRGSASSLVTADCEGWETTATNFSNSIQPFSGTHKTDFFTWLFRLKTYTSTPLREAMVRVGNYYSTSGENSPYDNDFTTAASGELACRKNFHILMTDGIWNDSVTGYSNADNTDTTFPDTTTYTAAAPYKDTNSNSLADIAFYFWKTDLRSGLTNNLIPYMPDTTGSTSDQYKNPKNDPATWQHMVNYTVGLGLTSFLANTGLTWGGDTYSGSYSALKAGTTAWPATGSSLDGNTADLWHAAINSRGQFFNADTPQTLVNAFATIMSSISSKTASSAALAANSTSIQTGTVVYQAQFNSEDWSGHLYNFAVSGDGTVHDLNLDGRLDGTDANWDAATLIPAHDSRNILTHNGSTGISFTWTNLTTGQKALLQPSDTLGQDRLNWLRGDSSKEARFTGGIFRNRTGTVLGDIVNSDPIFSKDENYGYASLPAGTERDTYAAYVTAKGSRTPMVYVGANDGMLHGFRADVGNTNSGKELFAYVPGGVYSNLTNLTDTAYTHKYFVDGPAGVGDAFWTGAWKTILVGGLGGGGKSIYALDISAPDTFDATKVLWEYTDTDLGLTYSQPQIARLHDGSWAAIFGNGYNSTSDKAFLYIVNLQTGALITKIPAGSATSNGLSTPVLYDSDNDKITDTVYAGDLQGNMWKFDLSSSSSTSWVVANLGAPLFTARNASNQVQPITSQPRVGGHPTSGVLVYFGTGQYLTTPDNTNTDVQSYYAIWDNGSAVTATDRSTLQAQTIVAETDEYGYTVRETSSNTVDYAAGKRGWYMDLVPPSGQHGERVVSTSLLKYDRVIFATLIPSSDRCVPGGESWLMELDAVSGARTATSSFDFNNDTYFNGSDNLASGNTASGVKSRVGIIKLPVWLENPTCTGDCSAFKEMSGSTGGIMSLKNKAGTPPPSAPPSRVLWQQIL